MASERKEGEAGRRIEWRSMMPAADGGRRTPWLYVLTAVVIFICIGIFLGTC